MTKYLIFAILLLLAIYGILKAWPLINGPSISVEFPMDNASFPGGIAVIRGKAERAAQLTINGAQVPHQENGSFSTTLTLPNGNSILSITAIDRFGRRTTMIRNVFVP